MGVSGAVYIGAMYLLARMNVWEYQRRNRMTPEERKADDEKRRRDSQIW